MININNYKVISRPILALKVTYKNYLWQPPMDTAIRKFKIILTGLLINSISLTIIICAILFISNCTKGWKVALTIEDLKSSLLTSQGIDDFYSNYLVSKSQTLKLKENKSLVELFFYLRSDNLDKSHKTISRLTQKVKRREKLNKETRKNQKENTEGDANPTLITNNFTNKLSQMLDLINNKIYYKGLKGKKSDIKISNIDPLIHADYIKLKASITTLLKFKLKEEINKDVSFLEFHSYNLVKTILEKFEISAPLLKDPNK